MPPKKIPAPSLKSTTRAERGPVRSRTAEYPSEKPGRSRRGDDPPLQAGKARTNRPAQRERENEAAMSARGGKPDGRSPVRGQGVFDSSFENRPPASQTREPMQRRQRRRGDGSLQPVDADE